MGFQDQLKQAGLSTDAGPSAAQVEPDATNAPENSKAPPAPGRYAGVKGWNDRDPNLTEGVFILEVLETKEHQGEFGVYFHVTARVAETSNPSRHPVNSRGKCSQNTTPNTKAGKVGQPKVLGWCRAMAEFNTEAEFKAKVVKWPDLIDAAIGCEVLRDGSPNPFGKNPFKGQFVRVVATPSVNRETGKPVLAKDGTQFHDYVFSPAKNPGA